MSPSLILVRHAAPRIAEEAPATSWVLSDEGRAAAAALGAKLRRLAPAAIVSSPEPKAVETAQIIAAHFGLDVAFDDGFVEQRRPELGFMTREQFESAIRSVFDQPSRGLFGGESLDAAFVRFEAALARHSARPLLIASHGTVLSNFLGRRSGIDCYALWSSLKLPEALVVDEGGALIERIDVQVPAHGG